MRVSRPSAAEALLRAGDVHHGQRRARRRHAAGDAQPRGRRRRLQAQRLRPCGRIEARAACGLRKTASRVEQRAAGRAPRARARQQRPARQPRDDERVDAEHAQRHARALRVEGQRVDLDHRARDARPAGRAATRA